ncbi:MAG: transglycosylase SLT domain-containing protein [Anaerolineales bacterium]
MSAASRGLSFAHPSLLAGFPVLLLAVLSAASAWAWNTAPDLSGPSPLEAGPNVEASPSHLSPGFTPQVTRWSDDIQRWSGLSSLDPDLIATVIQIESCGDPRAISGSGAMGLFQVMPFHFTAGEEPMAVETNARRGLGYLARGLELAGGDAGLALAGYNGGHGVIGTPSTAWPAETRRYVMWGIGILAEVKSGAGTSPTLASWLAAGGEALCRHADSYAELP